MFTLLLPCNRLHPWLEKCLTSVKENGPQVGYEILVIVNNASGTETMAIATLSNRILPSAKVLNSGNGTLADALNFGIINASHDYIVRLDSDDELCEGRIERQIKYLDEHPEVAVVGTYAQVIYDSGEFGKIVRFPTDPSSIADSLRYGNCVSHPTVTFRKQNVVNVGMYSNDYPHAEDYELWLKLASRYKVVNLPVVGINYRQHSQQVSQANLIGQISSTRRLAISAITTHLEKSGAPISLEQTKLLLSEGIKRCNSKQVRIEKARFELAQLRAFGESLSRPQKLERVCTILINNPQPLITWAIRKCGSFVRGNNDRQKA
jgi:hypothetical protein